MMLADGTKTGKADPAFAAHVEVVKYWAQAIWNQWLATLLLRNSLNHARAKVAASPQPWRVVYGPAAALVCTLDRAGWKITSTTELVTDIGRSLDLLSDPPIVVARLMEASVRR